MEKKYQLFNGNNIDKLRELEDNSVDAVVTDPPYGLSFMGKKWDYDVPSVELWAECFRVLKPGGHLLAFAGTRTQHRMAVRIEDAGFEIRDMIAWVYGSGFPKSMDVSKAIDKAAGAERGVVGQRTYSAPEIKGNSSNGWGISGPKNEGLERLNVPITAPSTEAVKQWEGWGTALKPAMEPITVARKPLIGTVVENILQHGTGALNIDECRVEGVGGMKWETPRGGIWTTDSNATAKLVQNEQGRWPANLIHDGSDEVVGLFPSNVKGEIGRQGRTNAGNYEASSYKVGIVTENGIKDSGSAARFFYCSKVSKSERNAGCDNKHPTVKPIDLMRYLCKLITPPGGIVLDPFMGSGSTGCAALLDGFKFIGMEMDNEYFKIAEARITHFNPSDFW